MKDSLSPTTARPSVMKTSARRSAHTIGEFGFVLSSVAVAILVFAAGTLPVYRYGFFITRLELWCGHWIMPMYPWLSLGLVIIPFAIVFRRSNIRERIRTGRAPTDASPGSRVRHFLHHVVWLGVVRWGGCFGVLFSGWKWLFGSVESFGAHWIENAPGYFGCGLAFGLFLWISNPIES